MSLLNYVKSLKLTILNTMYGTGPKPEHCRHWCMYDPLSLVGASGIGFKWNNSWRVITVVVNNLCYVSDSVASEWS